MKNQQQFVIGFRKKCMYGKIAFHVAWYFFKEMLSGKIPFFKLPKVLYRGLIFLRAIRHSKMVKRGELYKVHLYLPAYPSKAFFHSIEKLYDKNPGPISVVLSMTRSCSYKCMHCYQGKDKGRDLDINLLIDASKKMQDIGVSLFDIEGGRASFAI